jgi:hypothetical protein
MLPEEAKKDHVFVVNDEYIPLDSSGESRVYDCIKCGLRCINHSSTSTDDVELFCAISENRPMSAKYPFYYVKNGHYYGNDDVLSCVEMIIKDIIE